MLKALVNEARLQLDITTLGPLLVKTGYATMIGADMSPVLTTRNGQKEVFIPGSSLKGVSRSHIEKVINSIKPRTACNPLMRQSDMRDNRQLYRPSCGSHFNDRMSPAAVYADSCPACRLFGSTSFAGRLAVQDAYLSERSNSTGTDGTKKFVEHRDGIAIDRFTGGTGGGAKFDLEVVTEGTTFTTDMHLRNFEIWQLGMLFAIIQDMEDELIRIGSGRSRGLGKIRARISEQNDPPLGGVVLSTIRTQPSKEPEKELWGLGRWLMEEGESERTYGTRRDDLLTLSSSMPHAPRGVRNIRVFTGDALETLKEQCINAFITRMQQWPDSQNTQHTQQAPAHTQQRS